LTSLTDNGIEEKCMDLCEHCVHSQRDKAAVYWLGSLAASFGPQNPWCISPNNIYSKRQYQAVLL